MLILKIVPLLQREEEACVGITRILDGPRCLIVGVGCYERQRLVRGVVLLQPFVQTQCCGNILAAISRSRHLHPRDMDRVGVAVWLMSWYREPLKLMNGQGFDGRFFVI